MKVQSAFACSSQLTSSCSSLNSRRAAAPFIRSSSFASFGGAAGSFRARGSGQVIARLGAEACDNAILCIFLTPHLLFLYPNRKLQFEQSQSPVNHVRSARRVCMRAQKAQKNLHKNTVNYKRYSLAQ